MNHRSGTRKGTTGIPLHTREGDEGRRCRVKRVEEVEEVEEVRNTNAEAGRPREGVVDEKARAEKTPEGRAVHPSSPFVYSNGVALPTGMDPAESCSPLLAVDLIGPPLLFQGLAPLLFGFEEVARVRLLADRPTAWPARPAFARPSLPTPSGIDHPQASLSLVCLYWHESLPAACPGHCAALYADAAPVSDAPPGGGPPPQPEHLSSEHPLSATPCVAVALSLYDAPEVLRAGLLAAAGGGAFRSPHLAEGIAVRPAPPAPEMSGADVILSRREQQIIVWAADGWTNDEIARHLFLSPATVKTHLLRAYRKLGVERRGQLRRRLEAGNIRVAALPPPSDPPASDAPSMASPACPAYPTYTAYQEIWCETKAGYGVTLLLDDLAR
jgi:DNA-binding CsgD family transcriptional regulator